MKAHIFREFEYSPSPVTALCTNGAILMVFRRDGTMGMVDSLSQKQVLSQRIGYAVTEAGFMDMNTVVCLAESGEILVLDIATLQIEKHDVQATHIGVVFTEAAFAERVFRYTTLRNELMEHRNGVNTVVLRMGSSATALLVANTKTLLATADGWLRVYQRGECRAEIDLEGKARRICEAVDGCFVAVLESGSARLFDAVNGVVLDTVDVRQSALNAVCCLNGIVHMSGCDSRIISYELKNRRFYKVAQADFHTSEVLAMVADGGRIVTAGEDSVVVFNTLDNGRYTPSKQYEPIVGCGRTANYFYAAGRRSIDIFKINEADNPAHSAGPTAENASTDDQPTFSISPAVLQNINQKQTPVTFFLNFKTSEQAIAAAVSQDEKYIAYSTSSKTTIYNLFQGSKLSIEPIRSFGSASQLIFTDKFLVILEYSKSIILFELETCKIVAEIPYEDYRERIAVSGDELILSHMKCVIKLSNPDAVSYITTEKYIAELRPEADGFSMLMYDSERKPYLGTYRNGVLEENPVLQGKEFSTPLSIINAGLLHCNRFIYILDGERMKKYEVGNVMHSILPYGEDLVVLHTSWNHLKQKFKSSIFKAKFSN